MEFFYKNNTLSIESEKKSIVFLPDSIMLDSLSLEMPWEYEKWGFLVYVYENKGILIYQLRIEGYSVWYIPNILDDLSPEWLTFLWDLDILIMPTSKVSIPLIEKIESRMIVTYGESAHELATHMGITEFPLQKYRLKEADLVPEKTGCVVMGE